MGVSVEAYHQQLQALLPPGRAWPRDPDSNLAKLMGSIAEEFSRADARSEQLFDEMDPRSTYELLPDWERICGLPSACSPTDQGLGERQSAVHAKLTERGGQSARYYINLAARLNYSITITEFKVHHVGSAVNAPLCNADWCFVFQVNAPSATVRDGTVQSGVDESLRSWGYELLECAINEDKPAHTKVLYAYG